MTRCNEWSSSCYSPAQIPTELPVASSKRRQVSIAARAFVQTLRAPKLTVFRPLAAVVLAFAIFALPSSGSAQQPPADFDQMFIDMMVPHHLGAIEMARIAQERADHAEIFELAGGIITSQDSEIGQMRAWRSQWYGSAETPPLSEMPMVPGMPGMPDMPMMDMPGMDMSGMGAAMPTMDMAADVESLRAAPEPFDEAFIDTMIPHHQSAIDAARVAQQRAVHQEIRGLADAIIAAQQREIDQMLQWRQTWYGQDGETLSGDVVSGHISALFPATEIQPAEEP
jgi:uncharacterized protein (DUF305 family)